MSSPTVGVAGSKRTCDRSNRAATFALLQRRARAYAFPWPCICSRPSGPAIGPSWPKRREIEGEGHARYFQRSDFAGDGDGGDAPVYGPKLFPAFPFLLGEG